VRAVRRWGGFGLARALSRCPGISAFHSDFVREAVPNLPSEEKLCKHFYSVSLSLFLLFIVFPSSLCPLLLFLPFLPSIRCLRLQDRLLLSSPGKYHQQIDMTVHVTVLYRILPEKFSNFKRTVSVGWQTTIGRLIGMGVEIPARISIQVHHVPGHGQGVITIERHPFSYSSLVVPRIAPQEQVILSQGFGIAGSQLILKFKSLVSVFCIAHFPGS
jgi:hypothetical protein